MIGAIGKGGAIELPDSPIAVDRVAEGIGCLKGTRFSVPVDLGSKVLPTEKSSSTGGSASACSIFPSNNRAATGLTEKTGSKSKTRKNAFCKRGEAIGKSLRRFSFAEKASFIKLL